MASLSGTWSGTWTNTFPDSSTGSILIHWKQKGALLAGTISIGGTPCSPGGHITGHLHGHTIAFGQVQSATQIGFTGAVSGRSMGGTYKASVTCGNARGNWVAKKTS